MQGYWICIDKDGRELQRFPAHWPFFSDPHDIPDDAVQFQKHIVTEDGFDSVVAVINKEEYSEEMDDDGKIHVLSHGFKNWFGKD